MCKLRKNSRLTHFVCFTERVKITGKDKKRMNILTKNRSFFVRL